VHQRCLNLPKQANPSHRAPTGRDHRNPATCRPWVGTKNTGVWMAIAKCRLWEQSFKIRWDYFLIQFNAILGKPYSVFYLLIMDRLTFTKPWLAGVAIALFLINRFSNCKNSPSGYLAWYKIPIWSTHLYSFIGFLQLQYLFRCS